MKLTDETVDMDVQLLGGGGAEIYMSLTDGGSILSVRLSPVDTARLAGYLEAATDRA